MIRTEICSNVKKSLRGIFKRDSSIAIKKMKLISKIRMLV